MALTDRTSTPWRTLATVLGMGAMLGACAGEYAVRSVPQIAADMVGKPVSGLQEVFGEPRKVDSTATKEVYDWYLPSKQQTGASPSFQGCELEVRVDPRSHLVLGYTLSNIGWTKCNDVERRVRLSGR